MAPIDVYHKLKSYYTGRDVNHEPVLSTQTSALLAILFTSLYVLPFYVSRKTRPSATLNRDAPSVIKARIQTVSLTVTLSTIVTLYILTVTAKLPLTDAFHHLGLYPINPIAIVKSVVLTIILYLAPLYESIYVDKSLSPIASIPYSVRSTLSSYQGYRNYIAGPLTEELLFRCTLVPLHLLAHVSATRITFLTPLYFGIAHIHHFYEFHLTHPHTPLLPQLLRSVFQFGYTTIFGWYASFIYLRTGSLYAVFIIHAFCNWMGLPRFWGRIRINEEPSVSSVVMRGKEDTDAVTPGKPRHGQETPVVYTAIYYILLLGGAAGFYQALFPLTEGTGALTSFGAHR